MSVGKREYVIASYITVGVAIVQQGVNNHKASVSAVFIDTFFIEALRWERSQLYHSSRSIFVINTVLPRLCNNKRYPTPLLYKYN